MKIRIAALAAVLALLVCAFTALADGTWTCPQCGRENPDRANFCGGCRHEKPGAEPVTAGSTNAWVCPSCGAVCSDSDSFCMYCAAGHDPSDERAVLAEDAAMSFADPLPAAVEEYSGTFGAEKDKSVIRYTAPVTGLYRLWLKEADSGFGVMLEVRDGGGYTLEYAYTDRGEGLSVELSQGDTYSLIVEQYKSLGAYTVALGVPRAPMDLGGAQAVRDSVSYAEQQNRYTLYAPITGVYCAWIDKAANGLGFRIDVTDFQGYTVNYAYAEQGEGVTFSLDGGNTYAVTVTQYRDMGGYTLGIGMQAPTLDVTGCRVLGDRMYFKEQENVYRFTAGRDGLLDLAMSKADPGMTVVLSVYDADGYCLNYGYLERGDTMNVELAAGKTYFFRARQTEGLGEYVLRIGG